MTDKITPCIDIAFKKIFGVEENKDLLISLINSIVAKEDQVETVELLNPYNLKSFKDDKLSILDIKAKGPTGKRYNMEIQIANEGDYDKRALYYWAKLYTEQLTAKGLYETLNKTIGIHILNFTSIPQADKYHNVFQLREKDSHIHYFDHMELHTIELHKFEGMKTKNPNEENEFEMLLSKVKTGLDVWVAFLTRHDLLRRENLPEALSQPVLKKALHALDVMNFTKEEREIYEGKLNWLRIEASTLKKAETEAEARGERKQALVMARACFKKGMDIQMIAELTGLTVKELEDL